MTTSELRTFIGAPLDVEMRRTIADLEAALARSLNNNRSIRWEREENIHITLQFLGDTDPALIPKISTALKEITVKEERFRIGFKGVDAFGGNRPRVLILDLEEGASALEALNARIVEAMKLLGFKPDSRPYHPHVTLGRVRRGHEITHRDIKGMIEELAPKLSLGSSLITEVVHFESRITPEGSSYHRLESFFLRFTDIC